MGLKFGARIVTWPSINKRGKGGERRGEDEVTKENIIGFKFEE